MKKILWITFVLLLIDQISKIYVKTHLHLYEDIKIFNWFHIHFTENPGMAYGFQFGGFLGKIGLSLIRIVLIGFIGFYINKWVKQANTWHFIIPAALIFSGAIGNLVDSIFYGIMFDTGTYFDNTIGDWGGYDGISKLNFKGYAPIFGGCVVDMLSFPLIDTILPEWVPIWGGNRVRFFNYIFNAADSYITIGGIMMAIFYFFKPNVYPTSFFK